MLNDVTGWTSFIPVSVPILMSLLIFFWILFALYFTISYLWERVISKSYPRHDASYFLLTHSRCLWCPLAVKLWQMPNIHLPFINFSVQISEGLSFLHSGVKMVHGNLCLENIILNKSGSWKIMGFDFSISSTNPSEAEVCPSGRTHHFQDALMSSNVVSSLTWMSSLVLCSPSMRAKSGNLISLRSASPTLSTWPLNTSCPSAVTPPLTCTR